jgi:hypothetical protein
MRVRLIVTQQIKIQTVQRIMDYFKLIAIIGAQVILNQNTTNVEQVVAVYLTVKEMLIVPIRFTGNKDIQHGMGINIINQNVTIIL